jgi:hypothetical protein
MALGLALAIGHSPRLAAKDPDSPTPPLLARNDPPAPTQAPAPPPVLVVAEPGAAILSPGRTAVFTATVSGSANGTVTWAVDGIVNGNASLGLITPESGTAVLYTAPASAGKHTLTATSVADPTRSAASILQIVAPAMP